MYVRSPLTRYAQYEILIIYNGQATKRKQGNTLRKHPHTCLNINQCTPNHKQQYNHHHNLFHTYSYMILHNCQCNRYTAHNNYYNRSLHISLYNLHRNPLEPLVLL